MDRLILLAPLAMLACGEPLPDPLAAALTETGGCADLIVFAADADDTLLLRVATPGLVSAAQIAGDVQTTRFDLPADGATVRLEQGEWITDAICDDVIENDGPIVDHTWRATVGKLTVVVRPGDHAEDAHADVTLEGAVLTSDEDDDDKVNLGTMRWTDIAVGWLPG